ncbi:MAG: hypothetical protein HZA04_08855 [Nitrospinae bacterium]|nr:hypothetical protein [Nitrospinota bacterium]
MAIYGGLHISPRSVRAVLLGGKKMEWVDSFAEPYHDMESLKAALAACAAKFAGHNAVWAVGIPLGEFSVRHLSFPFANRRAIAQALPFEMETFLPYPAAEMESCFMTVASSKEETKVLACAIRHERLTHYKELLNETGLAVTAILPDSAALLHFHRNILQKAARLEPAATVIAAVENGDMSLCFTDETGYCDLYAAPAEASELKRFAAAVGREAEKTFIGGEEKAGLMKDWGPEMWKRQVDAALGPAVDAARLMVPVGLASAATAPGDLAFHVSAGGKLRSVFSIRSAALGAACLLALSVGYPVLRNYVKQRTYDKINGEIKAIFTTAVPGAKPVKPMFQMKQKLAALEERMRRAGMGGGGRMDLLWVLKRMSESLPEGLTMEVDEIVYEEDGVTVSAKTDKFESVNRIKELYSIVSPFKAAEVTENKTSPDGKRVSFKLRMRL